MFAGPTERRRFLVAIKIARVRRFSTPFHFQPPLSLCLLAILFLPSSRRRRRRRRRSLFFSFTRFPVFCFPLAFYLRPFAISLHSAAFLLSTREILLFRNGFLGCTGCSIVCTIAAMCRIPASFFFTFTFVRLTALFSLYSIASLVSTCEILFLGNRLPRMVLFLLLRSSFVPSVAGDLLFASLRLGHCLSYRIFVGY